GISDHVCDRIKNDYSFPAACTIRMRFAPKGDRAGLDIFWYDGGIKPAVPEELMAEDKELDEEGMMLVGDKGRVLAGVRGEDARLIPDARMRDYRKANNIPEPPPGQRNRQGGGRFLRDSAWIAAFKGGPRSYGDFTLAGPISDMMNLASISLRLGGRRLMFDS